MRRPGFRSLLSELVFSSVKWVNFTSSTIFKVSLAIPILTNFVIFQLAGPPIWKTSQDQGQ